jgi:hypothetical protein
MEDLGRAGRQGPFSAHIVFDSYGNSGQGSNILAAFDLFIRGFGLFYCFFFGKGYVGFDFVFDFLDLRKD